MKRTTSRQDAELVARLLAEAQKARAVGDRVMTYKGDAVTTIARIEGQIVTLANGDSMHISKVRSA